jgi:hypothetical protein
VWKFGTGSIRHTLLTGFEYQHQVMDTQRTTADLPNITNIFAPTPAGIVAGQPAIPVRCETFLRQ